MAKRDAADPRATTPRCPRLLCRTPKIVVQEQIIAMVQNEECKEVFPGRPTPDIDVVGLAFRMRQRLLPCSISKERGRWNDECRMEAYLIDVVKMRTTVEILAARTHGNSVWVQIPQHSAPNAQVGR